MRLDGTLVAKVAAASSREISASPLVAVSPGTITHSEVIHVAAKGLATSHPVAPQRTSGRRILPALLAMAKEWSAADGNTSRNAMEGWGFNLATINRANPAIASRGSAHQVRKNRA